MRGLRVAILGLSLCAANAAAQQTSVVRVRVVDTTGKPVAAADVAALRGLNSVIANGTTDAAGLVSVTVPRGGDEYQIVARRIGYQRGDHFFKADRDTVPLLVRLRLTPTTLPTVQVTAEQDLKTKRYHIDADAIADAKRPIHDGLDVVTKLRPDMMDPPGQGIFTRCGLYYLWINGKRIVFPPVDPGIAMKTRQQIEGARRTANRAAGRAPRYTPQSTVPVTVQSALSRIHPEHIAEMNYVDCRDNTLDFARSQGAVFVALKPGIGYDMVRGSYVADEAALHSADDLADTTAPVPLASYRLRVLGVFDLETGRPIEGAEVTDVATGTFARTTATGTVSLGYLPEGLSTVLVRKPGFAEQKLEVTISPKDTMPITLVMAKP